MTQGFFRGNKEWKVTAEQLVKFVANVAIQVAQPQVCYINSPQDAIDKKSSMCHRVSEAAKTRLGVDIAGSSLFDAIGHLRPPAPSAPKPKTFLTKSEAPFKFTSSTKVTKPSAILKTFRPTNNPNSLKLHSRSIILGHLSWQVSDDCFHGYKHHVLELPRD